jgi:asparagine synthase (glutamine-hydrolysing)
VTTGFVAAVGTALTPDEVAGALAPYGPGAGARRDGAVIVASTAGAPSGRRLLDGAPHAVSGGSSAPASELRGGFVLIEWDEACLTAARDQVGERSLVWARGRGGILVAGDAADLLSLLPTTPAPDPAALGHWLTLGAPPGDRTMFSGIARVPPAHRLVVADGGEVRVERYWSFPQPPKRPVTDRAEAADRVRGALETAVSRHAGEPGTAVMLSGGLDSAAVAVAAAARTPPVCTTAYSAVFPDHPDADESKLIDATAAALGVRTVRAVVRGGSVAAGAIPYLERWMTPPASPNLFFWQPLLDHAAASGVHTLLDGQGGDEVFALSPYLIADRVRRGDLAGAIALIRRTPGGERATGRAIGEWLVEYGLKGALPPSFAAARARIDARRGPPSWLAAELRDAVAATEPRGEWKRAGRPRWWAHLMSVTVDGPGPRLSFDDIRRRDTLSGVTSGHPLVDVDLLEVVVQTDPALAYHPALSRPLLRQALGDDLPDAVRLRPTKTSFDAPFHEALAGTDQPVVRRLLGPGACLAEYVDMRQLRAELLERLPDTPRRGGWALRLWRLLTAEMWLRTVADRGFAQQLDLPLPEVPAFTCRA